MQWLRTSKDRAGKGSTLGTLRRWDKAAGREGTQRGGREVATCTRGTSKSQNVSKMTW